MRRYNPFWGLGSTLARVPGACFVEGRTVASSKSLLRKVKRSGLVQEDGGSSGTLNSSIVKKVTHTPKKRTDVNRLCSRRRRKEKETLQDSGCCDHTVKQLLPPSVTPKEKNRMSMTENINQEKNNSSKLAGETWKRLSAVCFLFFCFYFC